MGLSEEYDTAMRNAKEGFFQGVEDKLRDYKTLADSRLAALSAAQEELRQTRAIMDRQTGELVAKEERIRVLEARIAALEAGDDPTSLFWEPFYHTEFTSAQDSNWTARNEFQDNDDSRNLPRNAVIGSDGLEIVMKREGYTSGSRAVEYTSADVCGYGIKMPNYFAAEVVTKMPFTQGIWPCPLWFRPNDGTSAGEIDVIEVFGAHPWVKATLHDAYSKNKRMNGPGIRWENHNPLGWHTFRIEKTPGRITIVMDPDGIDGVLIADFKQEDAPSGFNWEGLFENNDRLWYPRITGQVGYGNQAGSNVGQPVSSWQKSSMFVRELTIWKYEG